LEDQIPFDPEMHSRMSIDTWVWKFSGVVQLLPSVARGQTHGQRDRLAFGMR
jgi:hypothetical protein